MSGNANMTEASQKFFSDAPGVDKVAPPKWAAEPQLTRCFITITKEDREICRLDEISQLKSVSFGRNGAACDIKLEHPSTSRKHAIIAHGNSGNLYILDLGTTHGTFVNEVKLKAQTRRVLNSGDVVQFGTSTRQYHINFGFEQSLEDTASDEKSIMACHDKEAMDIDGKSDDEMSALNLRSTAEEQTFDNKEETGVRCYHILIKHKESRNPKSWKSKRITRTKPKAFEIAHELRKSILDTYHSQIDKTQSMESIFVEIASGESDCNSYKVGGYLEVVKRGVCNRVFEKQLFGLNVYEISEPFSTSNGVHILLRVPL